MTSQAKQPQPEPVCHCGDYMKDHGPYTGHSPVEMQQQPQHLEDKAREIMGDLPMLTNSTREGVAKEIAAFARSYANQRLREAKRALALVVEETEAVEGGGYYAQLGDASATRRDAADRVRNAVTCPECGNLMAAEAWENCPTCGKYQNAETMASMIEGEP